MIVLKTITTSQDSKFIPRKGTGNCNLIIVTDEQTNISTNVNIVTYTSGDYYDTASGIFALKEGRTYSVKVCKNNINDLRFYGRVFCTDQTLATYTSNDYISYNVTNEYIIYE